MNKRKIRAVGCLACILTAIIVITGMVKVLDAEEAYPSRQSITQREGKFTKSVSWKDNSHSNGNYRAEITLTAADADYKRHQPVDAVVLMSRSVHMFSPSCSNPVHETIKAEESNAVKKDLDDHWDASYGSRLPDITGLSSADMAGKKAGDFLTKENVAGKSGYLMPLKIYTKESGNNYVDNFKKRDNWVFVTPNADDPSSRIGLHLGEKKEAVAGFRGYTTVEGIYELAETGKTGMEAGCSSGSAIAALGAESFVQTILKNDANSRIALIPYGDKVDSGEPSFINDENALLNQIEQTYEVSDGYVNTQAAFEAAGKVLEKDISGNRKAVIFLTDGSIKNDNTFDDAVKIAEGFRNQGIETYVMGYRVDDTELIHKFLLPFAFDYNTENPNGDCEYYIDTNKSNYGLNDGYKKIAEKLTENNLYFTDYISEYFEVDKQKADPSLVVEDVAVTAIPDDITVQRVTVKVPVSEMKSNTVKVQIPIKLKDGYKDSKEFLNTNYIFPDADSGKGAKLEFLSSEGNSVIMELDSVYLQPDSTSPPPEITEAWLEFDLRGGKAPDGISFESVLMPVGTKISEASNYQAKPVMKGYEFGGWYLDKACKNEVGDEVMPAKNITIYAKWTEIKPDETEVKLTYTLWGGKPPSEGVFEPEILKKGTKVGSAKDFHKIPVKADSQFQGWYLDTTDQEPVPDTYTLKENTVLHAKWKVDKAKLIYMSQGGTLPDGSKLEAEWIEIGTYIADANGYKTALVKDGVVFGGWYMDEKYVTPVGTHRMPDETTLIYAKWLPAKIIIVDFGGGAMADGSTSMTVNAPEGELIQNLNWYYSRPAKEGYRFAGWYKDEACIIPLNGEETVTRDLKVYAKWEKVNMLSYDLQGGTGPDGDEIKPEALAVDVLISSAKGYQLTPVKEGFVFGGWYLEKECINPVGDTRMPDADKTIYAKWTPEEKKPGEEPGEEPSDKPKDEPEDNPKEDVKDEPKEEPKEQPEETPKDNKEESGSDKKTPQESGTDGGSGRIKSGDFGNELAEALVVLGVSGILAGGIWRWKRR